MKEAQAPLPTVMPYKTKSNKVKAPVDVPALQKIALAVRDTRAESNRVWKRYLLHIWTKNLETMRAMRLWFTAKMQLKVRGVKELQV